MKVAKSTLAKQVLVRRYNSITLEVLEKIYRDCTAAQAIAYFNKYKLPRGYGNAVVADIEF